MTGPTNGVRTLPHNVECEASILGGIIVRNSCLTEDLDRVEIEDFYHPQHRIVFEAVRNLQAAHKPIDVVTLEAEIQKRGKLGAIGGIAFLGELCLRVPTPDNVRSYRDTVLQLSNNRRAILKLYDAAERAHTWQHDPGELITEIIGDLQRIARPEEEQAARWCTDFDAFLGEAEPDDNDAIDWVIRDIVPRGENALFGGPMKAGKTWAAMDLMISVALGERWLGFENTSGQPQRVLGVFTEDNQRRLRKRLWELCRARGITPNDPRLRENMKISRAPLRLPDPKDQRRFTAELQQWKPVLVVVDNLTRVLVGDPNSTRDAAAFARSWTEIAEETGACSMFLHHTRKAGGGEKKGDVDPFDTLRGSGDFGAAARNILVTSPLRTETELLAEVRIRGNLDLRREGFVMGFERSQVDDRWRARLVDKGDIKVVKEEVQQAAKVAKVERKKREISSENARRRQLALHIAKTEKSVSGVRLARELGLESPRGYVSQTLLELEKEGLLVRHHRLGYLLVEESKQERIGGLE